ncbi:hypothetical protein EBU60_01525 [bacterium]|nr:hypothetical protein [bacterium]
MYAVIETGGKQYRVELERGPKTVSFKYRPKARSRVTKGHRQELHLIKVTEVAVNGTSAKALYEAGAADRAKAQAAAAAAAADKAKADAAVAATLKVGTPTDAKAKKPAAKKPAAKSADTSVADAE